MDAQETGLYYILIITAVVTVAVLLYSFISAIMQQLRYRKQYNYEVGSEILAGEKNRRWLASDMHDDLGPLLSATKLTLSGIRLENQKDVSLVTESIKRIDEISAKIRTMAHGLVPNILLEKGLDMAARQFIMSLRTVTTLDIKLEIHALPALPANTSIHLYRIIQEITHNTLKHAHASQLVIKIYTTNNTLVLSAGDDGIGFINTKREKEATGYGLTGIANRVYILNGDYNLRTKPGTSFFIIIPLVKEKKKAFS